MSVNAYSQRHEMQLDIVHSSGVEEWCCPTCGRRFLMQWPPAYKKVILEPGDETAVHSGGKGGLKMQSTTTIQDPNNDWMNDPTLRPWIKWIEKSDISRKLGDG